MLILLQDSGDGSKNQTTFTSVFSRTPKGLPSNSTALTSVLSGSLDGSAVELIEMYLRISAFHFYSELKNSNSIST